MTLGYWPPPNTPYISQMRRPLAAPSTTPTIIETRSSLYTTLRKSAGSISSRARPRTIWVLTWLPQLPAVPISMGMKETSSGRATKACS